MPKSNHELFELSQKVILYDPSEKKFLVLRDETSKNGPWDLPGGRVHQGEDLEGAVIREVAEEVGAVDFELGGIIGGCTLEVSAPQGEIRRKTHHFYLGIYKQGEVTISDEHTEYRWVTLEEIENDTEYKEWLKDGVRGAARLVGESEHLNDLKRLQADFENYKKRQAESQKELGGYLIEKLVLDIVPVLDNFRSATMHVPPEQKDSPWVVGIQYIEKQLETVLVDNGVTPIDAEPGEAFDPNLHEAVSSESDAVEAEGGEPVEPKGHKIAKVLQKGYKVGTKVVRPARVTVK